tara:strand:- start:3 stop:686 length:684 start_codon:yes stop_codon:yes gene_type:complete
MYEKLYKYTGVIAGKFFFNLFVITILFLPGCALKFPVPDETNQTILIIPVETRQTLGHFVFTLDLSIKGSSGNDGIIHTVEPNPKILFSYNTKLKPGKYKITKLVMQAKPGLKLGGGAKNRPEKMKDKIEFELQKGKITIIDKLILFQQPKSKLGKPPKRGQNQQKKTDVEKHLEKVKRDKERKADQKAMKKQRVRQVQLVNLDESFKAKILKELKEVENIDQWQME